MTIKTKMKLSLVGRRTYTVIPYSGGYVNGRWEQVAGTPFEVMGNEQPSGPQEIQMLPDSFRSKDVRLFMTTTNLRTVQESDGKNPDKVTIDGVRFDVHKKKSYQMGPRQHYELIIVREEQSTGGTQ